VDGVRFAQFFGFLNPRVEFLILAHRRDSSIFSVRAASNQVPGAASNQVPERGEF
jgi:hypothetical protein